MALNLPYIFSVMLTYFICIWVAHCHTYDLWGPSQAQNSCQNTPKLTGLSLSMLEQGSKRPLWPQISQGTSVMSTYSM